MRPHAEAKRLAETFGARSLAGDSTSLIFEITDAPGRIDSFIEAMRPLGLMDVSRTGVAAMSRGPDAM